MGHARRVILTQRHWSDTAAINLHIDTITKYSKYAFLRKSLGTGEMRLRNANLTSTNGA